MPKSLLHGAFAGAAAFIAAHAIEAAARIGGEQPWFIAALPSAALTSVLVAAAGLLVGWMTRVSEFVEAYLVALSVATGAAIPMTITLFTNPQGPGNLFPFALVIGAIVLVCASFSGVSLGWLLRRPHP